MDIIIHLGVYKNLRQNIGAQGWVLLTAIALDVVVLTAFGVMKWQSDPLIVLFRLIAVTLVFLFEWLFLARNPIRHRQHDKQ